MKIQDDILPTLKLTGVVTIENAVVGARVKRGPDWIWRDQDQGGEGVITALEYEGEATVKWDWVFDDDPLYCYSIDKRYELEFA